MPIALRSFAKINLGLKIGPARADGFHELRTIYQTIALYDVVRVEVQNGTGIEIGCDDPRVPCDATNTCYKVAERVMKQQAKRGKVIIEIEKRLPVQGGMGAASSNAVAAMLGLERALGVSFRRKTNCASLPKWAAICRCFSSAGPCWGSIAGRKCMPCRTFRRRLVVVTPPVGVSTPKAFAQWDALIAECRRIDRSCAPQVQ